MLLCMHNLSIKRFGLHVQVAASHDSDHNVPNNCHFSIICAHRNMPMITDSTILVSCIYLELKELNSIWNEIIETIH